MRIAHVITRMIVGGAQENTLLTLRGHLEHGHEAVLVTGPTEGPEGKLLQEQPLPGLRVIEIPDLCREISPQRDLRALRALRACFEQEKFDIVHTHSSKAGILGRQAARQASVPKVVHTVHGQAFHPYQSWLKNQLYIAAERWAAGKCDRIYAVAQAMIDQCVAAKVAPAEKYEVVYSGMELEPFLNVKRDPELRAQLGIPDDAIVIGKIARLFELKGHDLLIDAAPAICNACHRAHFLLVGDGLWRERLQARIREAGLTKHFSFTGLVPPSAIPALTGQMDILAHLSLREGLPRSVVQGLAAALPVVAHPLDGTPEVVRDNCTGLLVPPGNAAAVAAALIVLLRDCGLRKRLGDAGRLRVHHDFDWRTMVAALETSYTALLNE